jgi:hypothetical protein
MTFDDGPTLIQIFKGNNSGCGYLIRDKFGFAKQSRELHGKTGRVGGGDQFFRIGADATFEAGTERALRFGQYAAFGGDVPFP